jgi:hypothetical protein
MFPSVIFSVSNPEKRFHRGRKGYYNKLLSSRNEKELYKKILNYTIGYEHKFLVVEMLSNNIYSMYPLYRFLAF